MCFRRSDRTPHARGDATPALVRRVRRIFRKKRQERGDFDGFIFGEAA
jgi:hypothetical protein